MLLRALRVDLRRSICSPRFVLSVFLMFLWLYINGNAYMILYEHVMAEHGIPDILEHAAIGAYGLDVVVLAVAAIPYATSYLQDRESCFDRSVIARVGLPSYTMSRVVTVALSAALSMVLAQMIYILVLAIGSGNPRLLLGGSNVTSVTDATGEYWDGTNVYLCYRVGPWFYYLVRFCLSGLSCATAAAFALYVSALVPNEYVVFLSPLVGFDGFGTLLSLILWLCRNHVVLFGLLRMFSPNYFFAGSFESLLPGLNGTLSILWAVVAQITFIVLFGWGFHRKLRKEQGS